MTSMRICQACSRPNGPHFARCMSCGGWIGEASATEGGPIDEADASLRAVRLLEGLTPERRALLPEEFLRSLQKQARGEHDLQGESGTHRALSIPEPPPVLGPEELVEPSPDVLFETLLEPPKPTQEPTSPPPSIPQASKDEPGASIEAAAAGHEDIELPPVGHAAFDVPPQLRPPPEMFRSSPAPAPEDLPTESALPMVAEEFAHPWSESFPSEREDPNGPAMGESNLPVMGESNRPLMGESRTPTMGESRAPTMGGSRAPTMGGSVGSVMEDIGDSLDDMQWSEDGSDAGPMGERKWEEGPLMQALVSGRGPFGNREDRFRLLLLPDISYEDDPDTLRKELSEIMKVDLYTAGLWLKRPVPTMMASGSDSRQLETQVIEMRLAGFEVLLIERGYWLDGILPLDIRSMGGVTPGPVTFFLQDGGVETVGRERFGYCVLGDLNVPGGYRGFILDLYLADMPVCFRIRSDRFDFSVLGGQAQGPVALLMHRLIRWLSLEPTLPLPLDEAFRLVQGSALSKKSASPEFKPVVVDFSEYSLLCDQGRRTD